MGDYLVPKTYGRDQTSFGLWNGVFYKTSYRYARRAEGFGVKST